MKPTLKDRVLDPAMGSAGFLLEASNYVNENYPKELMKKENTEHYKTKMFSGFDTDQSMLRIGAMNMMLHGVEAPNIKYQDSLSGDNTERDCYSLIMANPPFKGNVFQEEISKDILSVAKTGKTELLFVSLFTKMLETGGRCASIVPDGVLFNSTGAYVSIRKELVENQKLVAIISMPAGVFKPYATVSTAIIIFTKTNAGGTDKVWFYDMKADGYSLDDKRNPITEDDVPDVIARFNNLDAEYDRDREQQSFFVTKEEIVANDYDLAFNTYRKAEYVPVEYPTTDELVKKINGLKNKIDSEISKWEAML